MKNSLLWDDQTAIDDFLNAGEVGHVTSIDAEGRPHTVPVNYLWHGNSVYFHTGNKSKVANIRQNPKVCFIVTEPLSILTSDFTSSPCQDTQLGRSVLIHGQAREIKVPEQKLLILKKIISKYDSGAGDQSNDEDMAPESMMEKPGFQGCLIIEIEAENITARSSILTEKPEKYRKTVASYLQQRGQNTGDQRDIKTALLLNQSFDS